MKLTSAFILVTGLATALQVASAADITGTVTLKGTPPAEKEISPLESDPTCGKLHTGKVMTSFYVVGANGELADTVVMLKSVKGQSKGATAQPAVIDQKGCLYSPGILAVQTGQKILVKNSDPVLHNIHTKPTAAGNSEQNQAQWANGPDLTLSFSAPENFIKFQCDVHIWMFAWVTVVDSPYYAVTGKDGSFKISNVPAGKYTITALHRKAAPAGMDKEIEVTDAGAKADFTLEVK
jgi:plastocyanin